MTLVPSDHYDDQLSILLITKMGNLSCGRARYGSPSAHPRGGGGDLHPLAGSPGVASGAPATGDSVVPSNRRKVNVLRDKPSGNSGIPSLGGPTTLTASRSPATSQSPFRGQSPASAVARVRRRPWHSVGCASAPTGSHPPVEPMYLRTKHHQESLTSGGSSASIARMAGGDSGDRTVANDRAVRPLEGASDADARAGRAHRDLHRRAARRGSTGRSTVDA